MKIVITGTPGTGKSTISKILAEILNLRLISISNFVKSNHLLNEKSHEVDITELKKYFLDYLSSFNDYIVEGHLACEFGIPADYVIILRSTPDTLRKRFEHRKYSKRKSEENILSELLDYCVQRTNINYTCLSFEVDTSSTTPKSAAFKIKVAITKNKKKIDEVNYTNYLKEHLGISTNLRDRNGKKRKKIN